MTKSAIELRITKKTKHFFKQLLCQHYYKEAIVGRSYIEIEKVRLGNKIWHCVNCSKRITKSNSWRPVYFDYY